jgi:hypothetical protein
MTAAVFAPPVRARPTLTRVIIAASVGNALLDFERVRRPGSAVRHGHLTI